MQYVWSRVTAARFVLVPCRTQAAEPLRVELCPHRGLNAGTFFLLKPFAADRQMEKMNEVLSAVP